MAARLTTAALLALMIEQNAALNARLDAIQEGQHSTPAPVVEAVKVSKATPKARKGKTTTKVAPAVSTKVPMPEAVKAGFAMLRDTKEAIRPLNKALDWKSSSAKATERPVAEIKAALKRVEAEHGTDVAQAALEAYKTRLAAAKKRAASK